MSSETKGPWIAAAPGVRRRTMAVGEKMMQVCVEFEPNASTPEHAHVHEQFIYVIAGELLLTVGGRETLYRAGESVALGSNVPHAARVTAAGATLLDTFTPLREDFLAQDKAHGAPSQR